MNKQQEKELQHFENQKWEAKLSFIYIKLLEIEKRLEIKEKK